MNMKRILMIAAVAAVISIMGCTSMTKQQQGTSSGAAIGAVAGAGIVALAGGSAWTGAAVGLVAGGIAGHIKADKEEQNAQQQGH
jgi:osmotically inducible lipoprotein OsmB